tara:strand:- start:2865 stop:3053 length:189 start_codon:yes stop_codon:yes gene_type:complete
MENSNFTELLERIAVALERQNSLLENQESRQMRLDLLEAKIKKMQITESKNNKSKPLVNKQG